MKKSIFFILLSLPFFGLGQITINSGQLPYAGLAYITASDTFINTPVPAGGMNQVWDFSSLTNDVQDTSGFINAAGTPFDFEFPASNLASHSPLDSTFVYMTTNASGFYLNGSRFYGDTSALPFPVNKFVFNPPYLFIPIPFTYGSTRNSSFRFQLDFDFQGTPARLISNTQQTFEGDGYGSLQLPNANYPNTLRIKTVETSFDSLLVELAPGIYIPLNSSVSQSTAYYWLRTAQPSLVMTLESDSLGTTALSADFFEGTAVTGLSNIHNSKAPEVKVYPNPATSFLFVSLPQTGTSSDLFRMFDLQGRLVFEQPLEGLNQYGFEVTTFSNGPYTWNISSRNVSGKIVIQH